MNKFPALPRIKIITTILHTPIPVLLLPFSNPFPILHSLFSILYSQLTILPSLYDDLPGNVGDFYNLLKIESSLIIRLWPDSGYLPWRICLIHYTARQEIPAQWAVKTRCPICANASLRVIHRDGQPDHMACVSCGCAFELEMEGLGIRLLRIGPGYRHQLMAADGIWMPALDIRRLILNDGTLDDIITEQVPPSSEKPVIVPPLPIISTQVASTPSENNDVLDQGEVTHRTISLDELGNTPAKIRTTLLDSGIPEERIETALVQLRTKKIKRKSPLPLAMAITILVIIGCLAGVAVYLPRVNIWSILGPFTPTLTAVAFPQREVIGTAVPPGSGLPGEASGYFNVVWNLKGNYLQKSSQLNAVTPPQELVIIHQQAIEKFSSTGFLESAYMNCMVEYDHNLCSETQSGNSSFCKDIRAECSRANISFLQDQAKLFDFWLGPACESFNDYYLLQGAAFPFTEGNCKYP